MTSSPSLVKLAIVQLIWRGFSPSVGTSRVDHDANTQTTNAQSDNEDPLVAVGPCHQTGGDDTEQGQADSLGGRKVVLVAL